MGPLGFAPQPLEPLMKNLSPAPFSSAAFLAAFAALLALGPAALPAGAQEARSELRVLASIPPMAAIAAAVVPEATSLLGPGTSPHGAQLTPARAAAAEEARIFFAVDESLEGGRFLEGLEGLADEVVILFPLLVREEEGEDARHDEDEHGHEDEDGHGHKDEHGDDHGHEDEDGHGHEDEDEHGHGDKDEHGHGDEDEHGHEDEHEDEHGDGHGHDHGGVDPHIWLDPKLASAAAALIAERIAAIEPARAEEARAGAEAFAVRAEEARGRVKALLAPYAGRPFILHHAAFARLLDDVGLTPLGHLLSSPERPSGAADLARLRQAAGEAGPFCLFLEPQIARSAAVRALSSEGARVAEVDILGAEEPYGIRSWERLYEGVAESLAGCLAEL